MVFSSSIRKLLAEGRDRKMVKTSNGVFLCSTRSPRASKLRLLSHGIHFRAGKLQFELPNLLLEIAECRRVPIAPETLWNSVSLGLAAFEWRK